MSLLAPTQFATVGMVSDLFTYNNTLAATSSNTLANSGLYSGPAFTLGGPASVGPPLQLGFKVGDKLLLKGYYGSEPNHGRVLTLSDPVAISVFETLVYPDTSDYQFTVYRRSQGRCLLTLQGFEALTRLVSLEGFGSPDVPISALRPRWVAIGGGSQEEAQGVSCLVAPLPVTTGVYLKTLDSSLTTFPTVTSVAMKTVYAIDEVTYAAPVAVSEVGLIFDAWVSGSGSVDPTVANNAVAFYKTFEPLLKISSFGMEVLWELQF